ncbi:uncharacterized protein LOC119683174 [Teleopsis dalmanni]|uniref:uncharacterized protein LOC119683174 n=1 Tax=Teleopsis dalmanni TaxID=139649 RepID=UPI0018CFD9C9|nr:uncharacterized protein LOC119683174 [Teleopsis dalmanni]
MSAPVRTLDENSKNNLFAANKKKSRRRKLVCRNISCDKSDNTKDFILDTENNSSGKKLLTRSRSVAAPDLVTLVSLVSSEGSESENDDDLLQTASGKSNENTLRRAPLLRKTGKSVSFQEHFTDNIQLSTKEYSMIRRGSIAPLAARLRANRPPTAPPVPVFINELNYADNMTTFNKGKTVNDTGRRKLERAKEQSGKENNGNTGENNQVVEYDFPPYVKSFKERECWKLYQKMIGNGVSVSYDTISRGMLTPTEFRQLQKQRECEEAKAREAEILNAQENVKK